MKPHFSANRAVAREHAALPGAVFIVLCHSLFRYIMHQADPTRRLCPRGLCRPPPVGLGLGSQADGPPPLPSWVPREWARSARPVLAEAQRQAIRGVSKGGESSFHKQLFVLQ